MYINISIEMCPLILSAEKHNSVIKVVSKHEKAACRASALSTYP